MSTEFDVWEELDRILPPSPGGRVMFQLPGYGYSVRPPRAYSTDEEPIPDFEVENCLIALPSYLFAWVVRQAEAHGLTESEFLAHFLAQHISLYDLQEDREGAETSTAPAPVENPPYKPWMAGGDLTVPSMGYTVNGADPDLSGTIADLHARFGPKFSSGDLPEGAIIFIVEEA